MSTVVEQGTIRNIIRGIDQIPLEASLFEPIDNIEHTRSTRVFIDMDLRNASVVIGYEHAATEEQLNNMIRWNTVQKQHSAGGIATAGTGHVYYEYLFRGKHHHYSYEETATGNIYMESSANTSAIYDAATNPAVSELEFVQINSKSTCYVQRNDEAVESITRIYTNADGSYPFKPKTIFMAKKITNKELLDKLQQEDVIETLRRDFTNKYYHELHAGIFEFYIKFPSSSKFETLCVDDHADTIGLTIQENVFTTELFEVTHAFDSLTGTSLAKGTYITQIFGKYFITKKNGACEQITIDPSNQPHLLHSYTFTQYTIPEKYTEKIKKTNMVGASMEKYSGIYLMIGTKLINSKPMISSLVVRNVQGCGRYRGILRMCDHNSVYLKNKTKLNSLKVDFNISFMGDLESVVKHNAAYYKKYSNTGSAAGSAIGSLDIAPESYLCAKSTNDKTKEKDKKGRLYIIQLGPAFYKVGITLSKNQGAYLLAYDADTDDFPEEIIWHTSKWNFFLLTSYEISNANSLEQQILEYLVADQMVVTYDAKKGGSIREYFHCDSDETMMQLRRSILEHIAA